MFALDSHQTHKPCTVQACARALGIDTCRITLQPKAGRVIVMVAGALSIEEQARLAEWCRKRS